MALHLSVLDQIPAFDLLRRGRQVAVAAEFGLEAEPSAVAPTVPESAGRTS